MTIEFENFLVTCMEPPRDTEVRVTLSREDLGEPFDQGLVDRYGEKSINPDFYSDVSVDCKFFTMDSLNEGYNDGD